MDDALLATVAVELEEIQKQGSDRIRRHRCRKHLAPELDLLRFAATLKVEQHRVEFVEVNVSVIPAAVEVARQLLGRDEAAVDPCAPAPCGPQRLQCPEQACEDFAPPIPYREFDISVAPLIDAVRRRPERQLEAADALEQVERERHAGGVDLQVP